jgi:flagellin-specific chaperone FliS
MDQSNLLNKYQSIQHSGKNTQELMVLVLDKAKNHIITAKNAVIEKDFVERGKHILTAINIFSTLARTITVKDEIVGSLETQRMYEGLCFQIENLIVSKAEAEEYDYYINYIDSLKVLWHEFKPEESVISSNQDIELSISSNEESKDEEISIFNSEGKFELVT